MQSSQKECTFPSKWDSFFFKILLLFEWDFATVITNTVSIFLFHEINFYSIDGRPRKNAQLKNWCHLSLINRLKSINSSFSSLTNNNFRGSICIDMLREKASQEVIGRRNTRHHAYNKPLCKRLENHFYENQEKNKNKIYFIHFWKAVHQCLSTISFNPSVSWGYLTNTHTNHQPNILTDSRNTKRYILMFHMYYNKQSFTYHLLVCFFQDKIHNF